MKDPQSHNTALANSIRGVFVPSWGQVAIYILVGFVLLAILNTRALWNFFNSSVGVSTDTANAVVSEQFNHFSDFTNNLFRGRLAPMLFWAFLGIVIYVIVWFFQNITTNVRNDFVAGSFKHPWYLNRHKYWKSVAAHKIFLGCSLILVFVYGYLCLFYWLPILARVFYTAIYDWQPLHSSWRLAAATLVAALLLFVFVSLTRMTKNSWRWISSNL